MKSFKQSQYSKTDWLVEFWKYWRFTTHTCSLQFCQSFPISNTIIIINHTNLKTQTPLFTSKISIHKTLFVLNNMSASSVSLRRIVYELLGWVGKTSSARFGTQSKDRAAGWAGRNLLGDSFIHNSLKGQETLDKTSGLKAVKWDTLTDELLLYRIAY